MKKIYLALMLFGFTVLAASSQTILSEDFETGSTVTYDPNFQNGWTTIDSYLGDRDDYRWNIYYSEKGTITGTHVAACDAPMFDDSDAAGPREEILLSPEINLDNTYQLQFDWKAASKSALEDGEYDFQVRVVEDGNVAGATTVWSFLNADDLKYSGITLPWTGFQVYNSKVDLSAYKGKKVKLAFVHKLLKTKGNVVYLDNVKVSQFTPVSAPVASLSARLYNFGDVYVGSKVYSDPVTLKNTGAKGLTISDIELPNGVTLNLDKEAVNLDVNESVDFNVIYNASLTSTIDGNVVIKTNGGDVTLRVVANKVALPVDATFENFEKGVPPAGWTSKGWTANANALEGDVSAYSSASFDGANELVSPRLDLSSGKQQVSFMYYNYFESETEGAVFENDITLEFSKDGGATWSTVWTLGSSDINSRKTVTVDLGTPASDNCYLKWKYGEITYDSESYPEISIFYMDCVVLPKLYGMGGVPAVTTAVSPENGAKDLYNKNIKLQWNSALFATGYKLYLGTDAAATNVVNGKDLGDVLTYEIASCDFGTTYNWKVVPYNEKGEAANAPVWSFTTVADQTVSAYPYVENFNGETFPSLGWHTETNTGTHSWTNNSINPYEGAYSTSVSSYGNGMEAMLVTPDFELPAEPMQISFYWGNAMPENLAIDETGLVENTTTAADGIDACMFEIFADGAWKQLAILSDKNNKYWFRERVDLTAYAGKTVAFRWRYVSEDYFNAPGAALDLVRVEPISDVQATFNVTEWNAGKVNFERSKTSTKPMTLLNEGSSALKIKSVSFTTSNFSTDLAAGTTLESKKGAAFKLTFNAGTTAAAVSDNMVVTFEDGYSVSLPVEGEGLAEDCYYYDFEGDAAGTLNPSGFTTIDVDRAATIAMDGMQYPRRGEAFAFSVQEDSDWNNVLEPVSGTKALVAINPNDDNIESEDWIVSKSIKATANSKFSFYARNWESILSIYPWGKFSVTVLVSTTSNTDTNSFEVAMKKTEMPYYDEVAYNFYEVDLSKYAGQNIYVAVRSSAEAGKGLAAFYDDFMFEHFEGIGGVSSVKTADVTVYPNPATDVVFINGVEAADVTVTSVSGAVVLKANGVNQINVADLNAGIYLLTVATENGVSTTRIIKK